MVFLDWTSERMSLKDFFWIIRRRLPWCIGVFVVIVACYAAFLYREKPSYRVQATVVIETPRELSQIPQGTVRSYTPQTILKNWQILVTGDEVKEETVEFLKENGKPHLIPIVQGVFSSPFSVDTTLTLLTATGETPDDVAEALNIMIDVATRYSKRDASVHLIAAKAQMELQIGENREKISDLDRKIQDLKQKAYAWDIPKKLESTLDTLKGYENQIELLDRKIMTNTYIVDKMRKDRAVQAHLSKDQISGTLSPTTMMSYEILGKSTPYLDQVQNKVLNLRFNYNTMARKFKPSHPEMRGVMQEIRDTESSLVQARMEIMGASMDREEAKLLVEKELYELEIKSLQQAGAKVQVDYDSLIRIEQEYRPLDRDYVELISRTSGMQYLLENLKTATEAQTGYVNLKQKANPKRALLEEKKTAKMAPFVVVIAVILSIGLAFVAEFVDTTIKTDVDIKRTLNYPVVGVIPFVKNEPVVLSQAGDITMLSEVFDTVATMIHTVGTERKARSLLITSTAPEEGKTFVSINTAIALARQGKRVTLVDGDMRKPAVHQFLKMENSMGFADLLLAARATDNVAGMPSPLEIAKDSGIPNLKVITSGQLTENPYSLMDPLKMRVLMQKLEEEADYVIIDTPPLLLTGDALKLAVTAGMVLFVIESGKTEQKKASWAKHLLTNVGANILGAILNKARTTSEQYYYYYRGYSHSPRSTSSRTAP